MGQEILYCSKCQTQLRSAHFEKGTAVHFEGKAYCKPCAVELANSLPADLRAALLRKLEQPPSPPTAPTAAPSAPGPAPTARRAVERPSTRPTVAVLAGLAVLALIVVGFLSTRGDGPAARLPEKIESTSGAPMPDRATAPVDPPKPRPEAPRDPTIPAMSREKREELAKDLLRKAREFAAANPADFNGQRQRFEQAVWEARETTVLEAARGELKALEQRLLESWSAELTALDNQTRPVLESEAFSEAITLLESAKPRRPQAEWAREIDRKIRQVSELAEQRYVPLKEKAIDARKKGNDAELAGLRERIRKWGIPAWTADLDKVLAEVAVPAPPKPVPVEPEAKPPAPRAKPARVPVPDPARQRDAETGIRKNFNVDQAKSPKEKVDLARALLQSAAASGAKEVELYMLLRLARSLAAQGGDARTALEAVDATAAAFEADAMGDKVDLFAKATVKGADAAAWAQAALDLTAEASEADDFESAVKLAARAESLARTANDRGLQKTAEDRGKELGELRRLMDSIKPHFKTLESNADDPAANAAAGKFICLMKEDWKRGLPMLVKGSDPALKALAEQELANPSDATAQAALGEAWATQAEKETPTYKARARERAAEWLQRALPGLAGTAKAGVEKKLASLGPKSIGRARLTVDLGGGVKMELISIRPGTFTMGGTRPPDNEWHADERPEHRVTISKGFYLGRFPVTRGQFAAFVKASGYKTDAEKEGTCNGPGPGGTWPNLPGVSWQNTPFPQTDDHPVIGLSWNDAKAFCDWAAKQTGRAARLPTEAEWEYACRAGNRGIWSFGDQESAYGDYGWHSKNSGLQSHPVGQKRPNPWGLYDMQGNVMQYVQDWAAPYTGDVVDPVGPSTGQHRIHRGGSYLGTPLGSRASTRSLDFPVGRSTICGLRVAISP